MAVGLKVLIATPDVQKAVRCVTASACRQAQSRQGEEARQAHWRPVHRNPIGNASASLKKRNDIKMDTYDIGEGGIMRDRKRRSQAEVDESGCVKCERAEEGHKRATG